MKILALGHLTGKDITPYIQDEQRVAQQMRQEGFILESFRPRERTGAILLLNEADAAAAERRLTALPFVEKDLITFDLVELVD